MYRSPPNFSTDLAFFRENVFFSIGGGLHFLLIKMHDPNTLRTMLKTKLGRRSCNLQILQYGFFVVYLQ